VPETRPRAPNSPSLHPRNAAATHQRILETALHAFAARGLDGVSLDLVAREAGVRKATLFYYFDSKDELYAAVAMLVASRFATFRERLEKARPSRESLRALLGELHDLLASAPDDGVLLTREAIDQRAKSVNSAFEPFVALAERYVRSGQRAGVFARELEPRGIVEAVVGALTLFFVGPNHFLRAGKPPTPEVLAAHRASAIAFVERAVLAGSPARRPKTKRRRR
jgi:TetR/AcrR family transcriptional regulator